jgi:hypothetical protein
MDMIQVSQQGRSLHDEGLASQSAKKTLRNQPVEYRMKFSRNLPTACEVSRAAAFDLGCVDGSQFPGPIVHVLKDETMNGLEVRRVEVAGKWVCG